MNIYTNSARTTRLDYQEVDLTYTSSMAALAADQAKLVQADGGTGEVSKATKVNLSLFLSIAVPSEAIITLDFPKFNPQASASLQKSYFVDPMNVSCKSIKSAGDSLRCEVT